MSDSRGSLACKATSEKRHAGMCTLVSSSPQGRGVACADHVCVARAPAVLRRGHLVWALALPLQAWGPWLRPQ